jgi:integrase
VSLSKLTAQQLQALYSALERDGVSPRTRAQTHAVLHVALRDAVKAGRLPVNPADAVDRPKVPKKEIRPLDAEQTKALLKHAEGDRLHALYVLAVTTGLRQGELLGLRWEDIDLGSGRLAVRRTLREDAGKLAFGEPKTRASVRSVDLPATAVRALREHRRRMLAEGNPGPIVFCDTQGGPLRKSNLIRRSFRPLLERAGLPIVQFHDLRHTAATLLLGPGVHPKIVQERLGHADISTTMNTYSHVLPSMQTEAADRLEELLAKA